jgi:hypothetical protein
MVCLLTVGTLCPVVICIQSDLESPKIGSSRKTVRKEYGDYFHEILEGSIVNKESVTRLDL